MRPGDRGTGAGITSGTPGAGLVTSWPSSQAAAPHSSQRRASSCSELIRWSAYSAATVVWCRTSPAARRPPSCDGLASRSSSAMSYGLAPGAGSGISPGPPASSRRLPSGLVISNPPGSGATSCAGRPGGLVSVVGRLVRHELERAVDEYPARPPRQPAGPGAHAGCAPAAVFRPAVRPAGADQERVHCSASSLPLLVTMGRRRQA